MTTHVRWGVCATIKASTQDILRFAAYYLDAGASRMWLYLDVENPPARAALEAYPQCTVIVCNDDYWHRVFGRRPVKHQVRQSQNATRTLGRAYDVDWLLHADVDEFVVSSDPVSNALAHLPDDATTARVRPMEVLASSEANSGEQAFKAFVPSGPDRARTVRALYPTYGNKVKGGFLSHLAGKIFVRTSVPGMTLRIHNALHGDEKNPGEVDLDQMALAHLHAPDWSSWLSAFDYRLAKGAYRSDLAPVAPQKDGGVTLHAFFQSLVERAGTEGLRSFFDEVCADTPLLRSRLAEHGLLRTHDLRLDAKLHQYFPESGALSATV